MGQTVTADGALADDVVSTVAARALGAEYQDLSADVVGALKSLMRDSFANSLAGLVGDAVPEVAETLLGWGGAPVSTVWGRAEKCPPPVAAFLNSASLHALEYDDTDDSIPLHPSSVVLPALCAELDASGEEVSGENFLVTLAVGLEATTRIAAAGRPRARRGWNYNAMNGGMGAVLAIARAHRWTLERTVDALGHQLCQTAGTTQSLTEGSLAKRFQPAFAAKSALVSAGMAAAGIGGPRNVLSGEAGYYALYQDGDYDRRSLLGDRPDYAAIAAVSIKPYPSCRFTHPPIDAAIAAHANGLRVDEIRSVDIRVSEVAARLVGADFDSRSASPVDAQFSIPYTVSVGLFHGAVRLSDFRPDMVAREDIGEFARTKVHISTDESLKPTALLPIEMTVRLHSGDTVSYPVEASLGSVGRPLSDEQRARKEQDCLDFSGSSLDFDRVATAIDLLSGGGTYNELSAALRP
jgi:2-methylcitrate dehydratase PrpD